MVDSFTHIPRVPPWNLVGFVAQSPSFRASDLAKVDVTAALDLLRVRFPDTYTDLDGVSAADVLDRLRFPQAARHLALEVFARSFFADPRDFAAGELVAMFHTYFIGSAEGLLFDVPDDDYDTALWVRFLGSTWPGSGSRSARRFASPGSPRPTPASWSSPERGSTRRTRWCWRSTRPACTAIRSRRPSNRA